MKVKSVGLITENYSNNKRKRRPQSLNEIQLKYLRMLVIACLSIKTDGRFSGKLLVYGMQ